MPDRDPRKDPRPGDVFGIENYRREVKYVNERYLWYNAYQEGYSFDVRGVRAMVSTFARWASKSTVEVIEVGDAD